MKLLTKEVLEQFNEQGDTSEKKAEDIKIICKYFNPAGAGSWYCYEFVPEDKIFWCFADLGMPDCAECGTVSLTELEELKLPFGMGIERDLFFPVGKFTLQEIIDGKRP